MELAELEHLESVSRLSRDLRVAAQEMGKGEVRYLVDGYYAIQKYRVGAAAQIRESEKNEEPVAVLSYLASQAQILENQIKGALDRWSRHQPVGRWMRAQKGVGPVISSGLLAHIDITRAPTVGNVYSFAGQIPGQVWAKGQKRPWNAALKVLCWKLGTSFKRFHGFPDCFYGALYAERKAQEVRNNDRGEFSETAAVTLKDKKFKKSETRDAYEAGKLPDGRLDLRAMRYPTKLFLSHMHTVMYWNHYGELPPVPFSFSMAGGSHSHYIFPPLLEESGFEEVRKLLIKQYGKENSNE